MNLTRHYEVTRDKLEILHDKLQMAAQRAATLEKLRFRWTASYRRLTWESLKCLNLALTNFKHNCESSNEIWECTSSGGLPGWHFHAT